MSDLDSIAENLRTIRHYLGWILTFVAMNFALNGIEQVAAHFR